MRGITPVIAIILLLLVTISIIGFAAAFFQSAVQTSGTQAEQGAAQQVSRAQKYVDIVAVAGNQVTVKNVGTVQIESGDVTVLVSGQPVAAAGGAIPPGGVQTFTITDASILMGSRKISVAAPANTAAKDIQFPMPRRCKEYAGALDAHGDGLYTVNISGTPTQVYCDMTTDGGGWTLAVRAKAGTEAHATSAAVGTLTSPTQSAVAKLSNAMIISAGKAAGGAYETRFLFDSFSDRYYFQWNNGYAADFNNIKPVSGDPFEQTRKNTYGGAWANEAVSYYSNCGNGYSPFTANSQCNTVWQYTSCHTGFGIVASCGTLWKGTENNVHRSGTMWVR